MAVLYPNICDVRLANITYEVPSIWSTIFSLTAIMSTTKRKISVRNKNIQIINWGDQPVEPWLLTLDLSRCLGLELCTVQFSRSFVLSCVRLWNGLHESVFAGEGLGAFKTSVNRFLLQGWLPAVSSFSSTISLSFFLFSGPKIAWGSSDL